MMNRTPATYSLDKFCGGSIGTINRDGKLYRIFMWPDRIPKMAAQAWTRDLPFEQNALVVTPDELRRIVYDDVDRSSYDLDDKKVKRFLLRHFEETELHEG